MRQVEEIKRVILYFHKRAKEDNVSLGKVRLTKLFYILDVEYYRDHRETFTHFNWIFYKYGPYTAEIDTVIGSTGIEIEEESITSEKSIKKIKFEDIDDTEIESIPLSLENYLHRIWSEWGTESLPRLLDFVYFETEPMIDAMRGHPLDFSKITPRGVPKKVRWTSEQRKRLHEIGRSIKEKLDNIPLPRRPIFPAEAKEIIRIWDEEEIANLNKLQGIVKIDPSRT